MDHFSASPLYHQLCAAPANPNDKQWSTSIAEALTAKDLKMIRKLKSVAPHLKDLGTEKKLRSVGFFCCFSALRGFP